MLMVLMPRCRSKEIEREMQLLWKRAIGPKVIDGDAEFVGYDDTESTTQILHIVL